MFKRTTPTDESYTNPLSSSLYIYGFINDDTQLDGYNLTLLLEIIDALAIKVSNDLKGKESIEGLTEPTIEGVKKYVDLIKDGLIDGAGDEHSTLKKLANLIVANKDEVDEQLGTHSTDIGKFREDITDINSNLTTLRGDVEQRASKSELETLSTEVNLKVDDFDTIEVNGMGVPLSAPSGKTIANWNGTLNPDDKYSWE